MFQLRLHEKSDNNTYTSPSSPSDVNVCILLFVVIRAVIPADRGIHPMLFRWWASVEDGGPSVSYVIAYVFWSRSRVYPVAYLHKY